MNQKLFIAIDLLIEAKESIRQQMLSDRARYPELYANARMIDEANWHITLLFLGDHPETRIDTIARAIDDTIGRATAPEVVLHMLTTAPPHRPPRMLWATTSIETNRLLAPIKDTIEKALAKINVHPQGEIFSPFNGHVTLARLPEGRSVADHAVSFPHPLAFHPKALHLMESRLKSGGAEYSVLRSIDFKPSV